MTEPHKDDTDRMMNTMDLIFRIFLGLNFFIFGLNGFFKWFAIPQAHERMEKFQKALIETGYVMTVVKWIEVISGLFLLTGFFVPLAILICGPIVFMIVSAHLFLNQKRGYGISLSVLLPYLGLLWIHWSSFSHFFIL